MIKKVSPRVGMYEALPLTEDLYDDTSKEYLLKLFIGHAFKRNIHRRIIDDHKVIEFVWQSRMITVPVGNVMVRDRKSDEIKHYEPDEYDRLFGTFDDEGWMLGNMAQSQLKNLADFLLANYPDVCKDGKRPADIAIDLLTDLLKPLRYTTASMMGDVLFMPYSGPEAKDILVTGTGDLVTLCPSCGIDIRKRPCPCSDEAIRRASLKDHNQFMRTHYTGEPLPQETPVWKAKASDGVELTMTSSAPEREFTVTFGKEFMDFILNQQTGMVKTGVCSYTLQLLPPIEPVTSLNPEEEMIHLCEVCRQELYPGHKCDEDTTDEDRFHQRLP